MNETLRTMEFGEIRIVDYSTIDEGYADTFIREDDAYEWWYFRLASGEVVAVENPLD